MNRLKIETFMSLAENISKLSPDPKTKVGCIAVHPDTKDAILPSYNGFIQGANDSTLPKDDNKHLYIQHAERNLIYQAAKKGRSIDGYWIFCTLSPCIDCCRALWQSGVRTIIFKDTYKDYHKQMNMLDIEFNTYPLFEYYLLDLSIKECRQ